MCFGKFFENFIRRLVHHAIVFPLKFCFFLFWYSTLGHLVEIGEPIYGQTIKEEGFTLPQLLLKVNRSPVKEGGGGKHLPCLCKDFDRIDLLQVLCSEALLAGVHESSSNVTSGRQHLTTLFPSSICFVILFPKLCQGL